MFGSARICAFYPHWLIFIKEMKPTIHRREEFDIRQSINWNCLELYAVSVVSNQIVSRLKHGAFWDGFRCLWTRILHDFEVR